MVRAKLHVLGGAGLVVVSCCAVEGSAALSSSLFDALEPAAVAAWRQAFGAAVLLAAMRPRLRDRSRAEWAAIGGLGTAIATMNVAFYESVERVPLGIAATLLYVGAFAVAVLHTEVGWRLIMPVLALVGVVLVSQPTGGATAVGICAGLVAAGALAAYTLVSRHLGRRDGLDVLALAVGGSALVLSPLSASTASHVRPSGWLVLAVTGAIGVGLAFSCDFTALRLAGTRIVATLFALDPVIGALIGAAALSQHLTPTAIVGIAAITLAGGFTTATRDKGAARPTLIDRETAPCGRLDSTGDASRAAFGHRLGLRR
jgi:inner membrane transporter RhtA